MTKYESATWKSIGGLASSTPVSPPNRNVTMKPTAKIIGVSKLTAPPHIEPIQLKNLMPVGTAMRNVITLKNGSSTAPVVNMWWAHTVMDNAPMEKVASTMP